MIVATIDIHKINGALYVPYEAYSDLLDTLVMIDRKREALQEQVNEQQQELSVFYGTCLSAEEEPTNGSPIPNTEGWRFIDD